MSTYTKEELNALMYKNQRKYYAKNRTKIVEEAKERRQRVIDSKKFYCEKCDKVLCDKSKYNRHLGGKKHNGTYISYTCIDKHDGCLYTTKYKSNYARHVKNNH